MASLQDGKRHFHEIKESRWKCLYQLRQSPSDERKTPLHPVVFFTIHARLFNFRQSLFLR